MKESFDILIVGAGASGLAAAISAKRTLPRLRVAMLERLPRVGKKILATGNGRCNLTNLNARSHGYTNRDFADSVFEKYDEQRVLQFFKSIGLLTYSDSCGRVYPMSNTASGVLDCLRFETERLGVKSICEDKCEGIKKTADGFLINGRYRAREIIICTGGCASPSQGSDGSGYKLLSSLGHTVTELYPSLVQLTSPDKQLRQLKGMRVHDAVINAAGRTSRGELLFTDYGLSGIAAMEISADIAKAAKRSPVSASLDLIPSMGEREIADFLSGLGGKCEDMLIGILPRAVGAVVIKAAGVDSKSDTQLLGRNALLNLARTAKNFKVTFDGTKGFSNAQVTRGGVNINEFDRETLESKKVPGLFCAGELLDVDGGCGGFNLQWAWASGLLAGESAAKSI